MRKLITILYIMCVMAVPVRSERLLTDSLHYRLEMQTTLSSGDYTPLWLNANRHGLSSLQTANGYMRGAIGRPLAADSARRWGIGYGADVAVAAGFTSTLVVQQLYGELRWLKGTLTLGSKEQPMQLKNQALSSGSQTFGINARPIPQLRLALPDYWTVPGVQWLALKGHVAYGVPTDERWQKEFTQKKSRYVEGGYFHSKAGYLRIGKRNITMELGLEMACQFGGTTHAVYDGKDIVSNNGNGWKAFLDAFLSGGVDATNGPWQNVYGNQLGSWVARLNMDYPSWNLGLYADHYFEDHSSMFLMDYDGYGSGENWNKKEKARFFVYDLKDMMLGAELKLKHFPWMDNIVVEYLYTKYQSGPVYHDHTQSTSDHISGRDEYYNHSSQTGWQHWGMVMGNPLYLSPLYNKDGQIRVLNNRFVAWHLGLSGHPWMRLNYRFLATWQRGFGTYGQLYPDPYENVSLMAEAQYHLPKGGWALKAAAGLDAGKIYGNNVGMQLTVVKTGILKQQRK